MSEITQNNKTSFYWPKLNQKRHSYVNWQWKSHDIRIFCNALITLLKELPQNIIDLKNTTSQR